MKLSLQIDKEAYKKSVDEVRDRFSQAFSVAENMVASMIRQEVTADIKGAGKFSDKYLAGLSVTVEDHTITTELDAPGASLFETGGVIHGRPLLWLPISGTDAEGIQASDYGGQLFSVNRTSGVPLLFSVKDHAPKYFGVPSVTIPKLFHIEEIQNRVADGLPEIFENALGAVNA